MQGPGVPELVLDHWWSEPVSDTFVGGPGCPKACVGMLVGMARAQPVPGQGLACWWVGWVCKLCVCGFLVSDVCSLVGEAGPDAKAGSLEGRAMSRGGYGLMES